MNTKQILALLLLLAAAVGHGETDAGPQLESMNLRFSAGERAILQVSIDGVIDSIEYHWGDRTLSVPPDELSNLDAVHAASAEIIGGEDASLEPYRFIRLRAGGEHCPAQLSQCASEMRFFFRWSGYESRWIWEKTASRSTTIYRKPVGREELPAGRKVADE